MAKTTINKAELAGILRLSKSRITQLIGEGLPVRSDGRISRSEAVKWYRARHPRGPLKTGPAATNPSASTREAENFMVARARKESALADLRELEAGARRGELLPRDEVVEQFGALIIAAKNRLRALGNALGPAMAVETDPAACKSLIDAEVDEALNDLSNWTPQ